MSLPTDCHACGPKLVALLLNPPTGAGARTISHLQVAADLLGCATLEVANMFSRPTPSLTEINDVGAREEGWLAARADIRNALCGADHVFAAWGVGGLHGQAAEHLQGQRLWVCDQLADLGIEQVWTLNGETRHPSRWHQYVSDRHGRTSGGSFLERLSDMLTAISAQQLGQQANEHRVVQSLSTLSVTAGRKVTAQPTSRRCPTRADLEQ